VSLSRKCRNGVAAKMVERNYFPLIWDNVATLPVGMLCLGRRARATGVSATSTRLVGISVKYGTRYKRAKRARLPQMITKLNSQNESTGSRQLRLTNPSPKPAPEHLSFHFNALCAEHRTIVSRWGL